MSRSLLALRPSIAFGLLVACGFALVSLLVGSGLARAQDRVQGRAELYADAGFRGIIQGAIITPAMHEEAVRQSTAVRLRQQFRIDLDWGLPR